MKEEFNLSEKYDFLMKEVDWNSDGDPIRMDNMEVFHIKDVKEFIRRLKEDIHNHSKLWLEDRINKLAGDKLLK